MRHKIAAPLWSCQKNVVYIVTRRAMLKRVNHRIACDMKESSLVLLERFPEVNSLVKTHCLQRLEKNIFIAQGLCDV